MPHISDLLLDRNGDGYHDDVAARLVVAPTGGVAKHAFWATLIEVAARIGLETHALPMPLVVARAAQIPDSGEFVTIHELTDLPDTSDAAEPQSPAERPEAAPTQCLTRLFTIDGALADLDGDRLPDASRLTFRLPEALDTDLGIALANFAARLGLESGGLTLPLVRAADDGAVFEVRPDNGPAAVERTPGGWLASGEPAELATLLEQIAATWPHITAPETGGVGAAISTLRRWLAGDGPEPNEPGEVLWQRDWSAAWETERIVDSLRAAALSDTAKLTVFASEPPAERHALAARIGTLLTEAGTPDASIAVLSAFKAGLSWLRDVVIPAFDSLPVARVTIAYAPLQYDDVLDMPIRWLQELFPGNELLATALDIPLEAITIEETSEQQSTYVAEAFDAGGASLHIERLSLLSRTQQFVDAIPDSGSVVVTTGGAIRVDTDGTRHETPVPTDLEAFWAFWQQDVIPDLLRLIDERGGPHAAAQPFFGELLAEVWVSEPNEPVGVREENDSAAEALAEDIYFATLDAIELYGRQQTGERCNAPGAIIPLIHVVPGQAPRARVTLRAAPARPNLPYPELSVDRIRHYDDELALDIAASVASESSATAARLRQLATMPLSAGPSIAATVRLGDVAVPMRLPLPTLLPPAAPVPQPQPPSPPMNTNIWGDGVLHWAEQLSAFPEITAWIEDTSYQGRPMFALSLAAPAPGRLHSPVKAAVLKPTYLIVARHHANEISSTNAAFQLAWLCATDPEWRRYLDAVNILILPYENPDGAALHARLASEPDATLWKHHPARFNALGFEFGEAIFDPNTRFGEARARRAIWERWPADVVVDNHGVPSHEWIQPFAGFGSPPRFGVSYWIVQALLYGIARWVDDPAYPEHHDAVMALRDAVSVKVRDSDIGDWNRVYGASYREWGQSRLPDRFPGEFHEDMLWHIGSSPPDPAGRGFNVRFPKTTALSWVTEVNDETATGEHLERVARAHLLANRATLDLLLAAAPPPRRWRTDHEGGSHTIRFGRDRPLRITTNMRDLT